MFYLAADLDLDAWITEGLERLQAYLDRRQVFATLYGPDEA